MKVLILGGGPAGAAAAITLRRACVDTTIVDPCVFPRYRPGETLHPGIEPLLESLGALESVLGAGYLRHVGIWVKWNNDAAFFPFGADDVGRWCGFQAPRADFDARLLDTAIRHGTRLLRATPRTVRRDRHGRIAGIETENQFLCADCLIDCTGNARWLARQLNLHNDVHSPRLVARYSYATGQLDLDLPRIESDHGGWTWLAEVSPGRYHWTRVTESRLRPCQGWVPASLAGLRHEVSRGADVTWRRAKQSTGPGWFLAGDAAALLDPSSSHGVMRAIMTGMMAGHLIVANSPAAYHDWLSEWFDHDVREMRRAYREANIFGVRQGGWNAYPACKTD